jgi:hypothetical protein
VYSLRLAANSKIEKVLLQLPRQGGGRGGGSSGEGCRSGGRRGGSLCREARGDAGGACRRRLGCRGGVRECAGRPRALPLQPCGHGGMGELPQRARGGRGEDPGGRDAAAASARASLRRGPQLPEARARAVEDELSRVRAQAQEARAALARAEAAAGARGAREGGLSAEVSRLRSELAGASTAAGASEQQAQTLSGRLEASGRRVAELEAAVEDAAAAAFRSRPPPPSPPPAAAFAAAPPPSSTPSSLPPLDGGGTPASMTVAALEQWLTDAGRGEEAWRLSNARAKKGAFDAAAEAILRGECRLLFLLRSRRPLQQKKGPDRTEQGMPCPRPRLSSLLNRRLATQGAVFLSSRCFSFAWLFCFFAFWLPLSHESSFTSALFSPTPKTQNFKKKEKGKTRTRALFSPSLFARFETKQCDSPSLSLLRSASRSHPWYVFLHALAAIEKLNMGPPHALALWNCKDDRQLRLTPGAPVAPLPDHFAAESGRNSPVREIIPAGKSR